MSERIRSGLWHCGRPPTPYVSVVLDKACVTSIKTIGFVPEV